jgi:hypothetical protein
MILRGGFLIYENLTTLLTIPTCDMMPGSGRPPREFHFFPQHPEAPSPEGGGAEAGLRASLDAGGQAEEDARLYQAVAGINNACDQVQDRIVLKTQNLLARKGIALEDPRDVRRAVDVAMTEAWEIDVDSRLSHFRNLHRYLGTRNCPLWPEIVKSLRDLGNPHVPDAEE